MQRAWERPPGGRAFEAPWERLANVRTSSRNGLHGLSAIVKGRSEFGFEEPQGWSRQAVLRTAPIALLLYSLIVLWFALVGHLLYRPLVRPWYRTKVRPSFADYAAEVRTLNLLPAPLRPLHHRELQGALAVQLQRADVDGQGRLDPLEDRLGEQA